MNLSPTLEQSMGSTAALIKYGLGELLQLPSGAKQREFTLEERLSTWEMPTDELIGELSRQLERQLIGSLGITEVTCVYEPTDDACALVLIHVKRNVN